jgi:serine-type D-Ala-D-Ala carboxypeptidase/endopeptidase (penicillin-binding protein 4)
MSLIGEFLKKAGVDTEAVSLSDGAGGDPADMISPRAEIQLLKYMTTRPDFKAYKNSLPILGVDGSLAEAASPNSPARGKVSAKTGTVAGVELMNGRVILLTKALAGYMTTAKGRELSFAVFVTPVPAATIPDALAVGNDLGRIAEFVYTSE